MNCIKKQLATVVLGTAVLLAGLTVSAQPAKPADTPSPAASVEYFLPYSGAQYNPAIRTPQDFFGFELGDRLADWGDITAYMNYLAQASDRVSTKTFGQTFEGRRFLHVYITSPRNQARLEQIRQEHMKLLDPQVSGDLNLDEMPLVVNLGGSIHGNEISGSQALIAIAFYWAAAQGSEVEKLLDRTVLVLTPAFNPDGMNRFCSWINTTASRHHFQDRQSREYAEAQPGSRVNHYWMDCNRDWLTAQHDVGRNGAQMYEYWMPSVLLDMHEMGTRNLFYFSPGDPNRTYRYIPQENQDLTLAISRYTERNLKAIGTQFFTRRGYDDFFIGKGACYGDIQGSVCILHEAASSRGHMAISSKNGPFTLPETIRWQGHAAMAVLAGADANRKTLMDYQRRFYVNAAAAAAGDANKGYLFDAGSDKARAWHFLENLKLHDIDVYSVTGEEGRYYVPFEQRHYYKIKGIFEDITQYQDSVFYDISTWSPARAYALNYKLTDKAPKACEKIVNLKFPEGTVSGGQSTIGYAFSNGDYYAPYLINALQSKGVRVEVAPQPFEYRYKAAKVKKHFPAGTLIVPVADQSLEAEALYNLLCEEAAKSAVDLTALQADKRNGFDLAAVKRVGVRQPRTAIITDNGAHFQQGTMWFLLDHRFAMNHSLVGMKSLNDSICDLTRYDAIIFSGNSIPKTERDKATYEKLTRWLNDGGTLILFGGSNHIAKPLGASVYPRTTTGDGLSGVVLNAEMEGESPILWGYDRRDLDLFVSRATTWKLPKDANVILRWSEEPYRSGYFTPHFEKRFAGTPLAATVKVGKGVIVYFQTEVNFRDYWFGANHLLTNAIYFGNLL